MYLTLGGLLRFFVGWFFWWGLWQFIWIEITNRGYQCKKEEGESLFDFCCRYYGGVGWDFRRKLGIKWFYNSKAFKNFVRLKGVVLFLLSAGLVFLYFWLTKSEYAVYLNIRF